ncbi:hypothetical protein CR513_12622, partial [Mucuna pruriens]
MGQFQESLGPIEASRPRRTRLGQTYSFPAKSSFKAQVTLEACMITNTNPLFTSNPGQSGSSPSLMSLSETEFESSQFETKCMTRSRSDILYELDPKIDRTLCRLRNVKSTVVSNSGSSNSVSNSDNSVSATNDSNFSEYSSFDVNSDFNFGVSLSQEPEPMEKNDQTLKELAMPDVVYQPWCEDPHKNLKEFHVGIPKDYIKMKAFPFSLDGVAKDCWFFSTPRVLRKARNIVVSGSSNFVYSSDYSSLVTNISDFVEYSSTNNLVEQMENNNDRNMKELATPDVVYQPCCIQYPQIEPAQTYVLKSGLIHLRRSPQALEGIPCGLLHNETIGDTGRLHQDEGVSILPRWSSKRLVVSTTNSMQHLGRYEAYVPGEVLFGIQNCDHEEGNMWNQATFWRNSTRVLGKIQQAMCHIPTSLDQ